MTGERFRFMAIGLAGAIVIIALGAFIPTGSRLAIILFDHREGALPPFPVTIACIEWLVFGIGAGELYALYRRARSETDQLRRGLLPQDEHVMHDTKSLARHAKTIKESTTGQEYRLQRILLRTIWQFQSSRSIDQAATMMDTSLELCQHELDLQYNLIRYIAWLLPTIGFIGTVWGLSRGLATLAENKIDPTQTEAFQALIRATTHELSVAFNTTLLALVMSSLLVFFVHLVQELDEHTLNKAGQYCLDHLINKLYVA